MLLTLILTGALLQVAPPAGLSESEVGETADFALGLYDPATGGFRVSPGAPVGLRATHGGVQVLTALGRKLPDAAKTRAFVESCFDADGKAFREPGQLSNPTINSVGIMAALSLGVPKDAVRPALVTLGATAKTFEEVRIGAAAVEAFGPKECPFELAPWVAVIDANAAGDVRTVGGVAAFHLRLGRSLPRRAEVTAALRSGQHPGGGYAAPGAANADLETTYRVVRALHYLGEKPGDPAKLRALVARCRREGGGYSASPEGAATMSGAYYALKILAWLDSPTPAHRAACGRR